MTESMLWIGERVTLLSSGSMRQKSPQHMLRAAFTRGFPVDVEVPGFLFTRQVTVAGQRWIFTSFLDRCAAVLSKLCL